MKEITFLRENAEKWKRFEGIIKARNKANPDELADLFVELTDDLAFAQTFFPQSKTALYLNNLTGKFHQALYKNKKEKANRLVTFWKYEQPRLLKRYRKHLFISILVFFIAALIGWVSSVYDESFVRLILGDSYVKMTLENIKKKDPMAVYKSWTGTASFLAITINNVKVAITAFAAGIFLAFGTAYVLFYNGIMLGSFHHFFYSKGLLGTSMLSIWIHGTLEIFAVLVAGCAGLVIGSSILFPGTYSRRVSFARGAREGLKILIGVVPLFIAAGFIEGYVTRHTKMPVVINLSVISLSVAFIIWYYFIYPVSLEKAAAADNENNFETLHTNQETDQ